MLKPRSLLLTLAWRNIWRHSRRTWLTVSAMTFSNVLLIFMMSLQFGMYQLMIDGALDVFTGHIQIQAPGYLEEPGIHKSIDHGQAVLVTIENEIQGVRLSARASAFVLASSEERSYGLQLVGVQPESEVYVSTLPGLIKQGRYLQDGDQQSVVIGAALARNLKAGVGDELTILGSARDGSMAADILTITGIFESGMPDIDRNMAFITLDRFQNTFFMPDQVHSIVIKVDDFALIPVKVAQLKRLLQNGLPDHIVVLDWNALEPGLQQAIEADLVGAWFVYGLLILLVAFSVMNTQLMSVLERTREFGIVMALGLRASRMVRLVLLETAMMAALGLILGIVLGATLTLILAHVGFTFPGMGEVMARFNLPERVYPQLSFLSAILGPGIVYLASVLAALYPALRLCFLQPIQAMRAV